MEDDKYGARNAWKNIMSTQIRGNFWSLETLGAKPSGSHKGEIMPSIVCLYF